MENQLWFGDNLTVLRNDIKSNSVDLVYLDPPFNSNANYNVLFKTPDKEKASAQAEAFRDTWWWGDEAERAFDEIMSDIRGEIAAIIGALRKALGNSDMMAYLVMMATRLVELRRVLRDDGACYLHCDPTASHYLKILLDGIFGAANFRSEIIWKRTSSHNSAKRWGPIHDTILYFVGCETFTWNNNVKTAYSSEYLTKFYKYQDQEGRRYRLSDLTGSGTRNGGSGKEWNKFDPTLHGRHWAIPTAIKEQLGLDLDGTGNWLDAIKVAGLYDTVGDWPHVRRYLDAMEGKAPQDIIEDIPPLSARHAEKLGYPTQKPVELLERIIRCSTKTGAVVLDPFCGCGTTVEAAQKLGRQWIGIDIAYHAVRVIEDRMLRSFRGTAKFSVLGIPVNFEEAAALAERDKYQFQWWANYLFDPHAVREIKRGADQGIDGELYFPLGPGHDRYGRLLMSVKGGKSVGVSMIRDFRGVIERESADMGLFVCLARPTQAMMAEAASAGMASTGQGSKPKLQIVSIEGWFENERPDLPHSDQLARSLFARRKSKPAQKRRYEQDQLELKLPITGSKEDKNVVRHFNPTRSRAEQTA